ncbi:MAG: protein jag [Clostridiales bacterium]|nr:protein jag [Clostridiales bacterium]
MKEYESSAKTVEEAISQGLERLGVTINDVTIDILNEGSKGLFGLFGSKQAKVRLILKKESQDATDLINAAHKKALDTFQLPIQEKIIKATASENISSPVQPKEPAPIISLTEEEKESLVTKAVTFLSSLTQQMGIAAEVTGRVDEENHLHLEMEGESMGLLIGRRGETLDALQYLTNLHTNKGQENYIRVTLDTENYRAKREESLIRLANRMANRAVKTGRRVSLEPMNPYERRIIHHTLQSNKNVHTHSEGDDPYRHLVITVKKK